MVSATDAATATPMTKTTPKSKLAGLKKTKKPEFKTDLRTKATVAVTPISSAADVFSMLARRRSSMTANRTGSGLASTRFKEVSGGTTATLVTYPLPGFTCPPPMLKEMLTYISAPAIGLTSAKLNYLNVLPLVETVNAKKQTVVSGFLPKPKHQFDNCRDLTFTGTLVDPPTYHTRLVMKLDDTAAENLATFGNTIMALVTDQLKGQPTHTPSLVDRDGVSFSGFVDKKGCAYGTPTLLVKGDSTPAKALENLEDLVGQRLRVSINVSGVQWAIPTNYNPEDIKQAPIYGNYKVKITKIEVLKNGGRDLGTIMEDMEEDVLSDSDDEDEEEVGEQDLVE